jgi:poly(hydroxyalkanoate) depolymerase family esterase
VNRAPSALLVATLGFLTARPAEAASLQPVSNWGASGVPSYVSMYIYVPDKLATNPPILVVSHYCGGSASGVFGQANTGGIVKAADTYGFILIFPQTTNPATSANCWDVGSTKSLTHDGGGDTQAVAQMVKYTITRYQANANRVYATGDSSGGMMTEALLAVYPDMFKAGSSFAGVAAGCWSAGWSAASNWGGTCAGGSYTQTAQQWGDKVRAMYPGYSGYRPRAQLFHGDADAIISYKNLAEGIKEWTNVLGLSTSPTSTDTGLTLGSHQATRQRWQSSCGQVVLEAITSIGGDHGPSDALFNSSYVIPFLGLDKSGDVDPVVAACSGDGGVAGAGGASGTGGATGAGGKGGSGGGTGGARDGGVDGNPNGNDAAAGTGGGAGAGGSVGGGGTNGAAGRAGSGGRGGGAGTPGGGGGGSSGTTGTTGTAGTTGTGGSSVTGGTSGTGSGGTSSTGTGGNSSSGGSSAGGGSGSGASGCSCALGGAESASHAYADAIVALGLALLAWARRRRSTA